MKSKVVLISLIILMLASCSDDITNPTVNFDYKAYFPQDSLFTWQYDYFAINEKGEHSLARYRFDTTRVVDSLVYKGKNSILFESIMNSQGIVSTSSRYYSLDSSRISISGLELKIDENFIYDCSNWITLYELYKSSWTSDYIALSDTLISNYTYNGTISFNGYNEGNSKVEYKGDLIDVIETKLNISFNILKSVDNKVDTIKKVEEYEYRLAKGIGLVYFQSLNYRKDSILTGGYEKVIVNYSK